MESWIVSVPDDIGPQAAFGNQTSNLGDAGTDLLRCWFAICIFCIG